VNDFHGYPTSEQRFMVAGRELTLLCPSNSAELIDQPNVAERFEDDEYLPYWSQLWSSSLLLAEAVAAWGAPPDSTPRVLEIGCGLGLVSLTLSAMGYQVAASDYDEDALAFVRENARRNDLPIPRTLTLDWRRCYQDLRFERIVAADVLYETRALRPVAEFIVNHLVDDGLALVVDPHRMTADDFEVVSRHCDLNVQVSSVECIDTATNKPSHGRIFTLRPKRAAP